jgi:type I restriction enzyme S subunit
MDTKQLRQKILDLAIRGKLVPQDPNDEPASVLLERVKAEKERLIAEGKIKRSKKTTTSSDKPHYPFEIPDSWEWTTIGEIASTILYGVSESAKESGKFKLLRITDIQNNRVNWQTVPFTNYDEIKAAAYLLKDGDILFARTGATVGKSYLVEGLSEPSIYASYLIRVQTSTAIIPTYTKIFFESGFYWEQISLNSVGVGQPNVNGTTLASLLMPIPPYQEQKRIVEESKKWLSVIDGLDIELEGLVKSIDVIKSKILDLAINGKLVQQDPADEPAADLLKRVNPNAVVSTDKSHYQHLPQGWCVCKLEDIVEYEQPQRYIVESTEYSDAYKTPVLTAGKSFVIGHTNETAGVFNKVPVIIFDDFTTDSKYVDFPFKVKSSAMKILHVNSGVNIKYVYYFMSITRLVGKTHKRYWISEYSKLDIPLPPYNEQCRIVDAIERINNRIDDIAEAL